MKTITPHDPDTLFRHEIITPEEHALTLKEMKRGASPISALSLTTRDQLVWQDIAKKRNQRHFLQHHDLRVLTTELITFDRVLATSILPHRTRGQVIQAVTYDPEAIQSHHPSFVGQTLDIALVSPSVWRRLYDLAYPKVITDTLTDEQMIALISCTKTGTETTLSPEQKAEFHARQSDLRYIDIRKDPVDDEVRNMINPSLKAMYMAYPHHLEGDALVMMMVDPTNMDALRGIEAVTQRQIIRAVTTSETIHKLLGEDDLNTDATEVDDALDRLTRFSDFL